MYNYNESAETQKEIQTRGRILMCACDIEFSLLNIIMFCNPDPNNHERAGQFDGLMMAGKIERAVCDMKKYKLNYYEKLKEYFDGLAEFKTVRNHFCHYVGRYLPNTDLSVFRVNYVKKDENDVERIAFVDYSDEQIKVHLDNFAKINGALFALWQTLQKEYELLNPENPFVHPSANISDPNL